MPTLNARSIAPASTYEDRHRAQALSWAGGCSYHNSVDNECCPDFSCCHPDLLEQDEAKRWEIYRRKYTP